MLKLFASIPLLSLASMVAGQGDIFIGDGDFPNFDFPEDDTFEAIANCCEGGCDTACDWVDDQFNELARRRRTQNTHNFGVSEGFEFPPIGPNADLDTVYAHCCCRTANCGGDPHFTTWNGSEFDFHGQCELVLVDVPEFATAGGLTIHIRTKLEHDYSFIETAAVKIGQYVLEVSSWGEYILNGVDEDNIDAKVPKHLGAFPITKRVNPRNPNQSMLFEIHLGNHQSIVLKTFKSWVSVSLKNMLEGDFGSARGLMGSFATGSMLARDGVTVITDANEFGQEWQVRPNDDGPSLFQSTVGPQYPEKCILPTATAQGRRRLLSSISREQAAEACAHLKKDLQKNCIFDILATGDIEMAQAYDHW